MQAFKSSVHRFTSKMRAGFCAIMNYVGGAIIYIRVFDVKLATAHYPLSACRHQFANLMRQRVCRPNKNSYIQLENCLQQGTKYCFVWKIWLCSKVGKQT